VFILKVKNHLQTPQVLPSLAQRLQYLQFLHALHGLSPTQVATAFRDLTIEGAL
jgi:hypothetical protein